MFLNEGKRDGVLPPRRDDAIKGTVIISNMADSGIQYIICIIFTYKELAGV